MALARLFLIDWHDVGQLPFAMLARSSQVEDAVVARCQAWIATHYDQPSPVAAMIEIAALPGRSFKLATGLAPMEYAHTLRLEEAKQLLESTDDAVEAVAQQVGYEDSVSELNLDAQVGKSVRNRRKQLGLTLAELSENSGISAAMISRIENAQSSASLSTLNQIAVALAVPVISLFEYTLESTDINFVRANEGLNTIRVTPEDSHAYQILGTHHNSAMSFSASQVTLSRADNKRYPVYRGEGFIFILAQKGSARYRCGEQIFEMSEGDTLSFDARLSNGVESLSSESFTFTSVFVKIL